MIRDFCLSDSRTSRGFTLLEMAFVLLVMGIVASMLVPTVASVHHKSMIEEDRKILSNLKDVLIGQFLATGQLPACRNNLGQPSVGNCDTTQSIGNMGVRVTDSRNTPIKYDVWDRGATSLTSSGLNNVCARLSAAIPTIATPANGPASCATTPDYDVPGTWSGVAGYCASTNNVAFVLVGTGLNRDGQSGEQILSTGAVLGNRNRGIDRVFENLGRRHNERWHYDDLMEVVTFQQLFSAVSKFCP